MLSRGLYWVNKRGILPACVVNCVRCLLISLDFAAMVHYCCVFDCKNSSAANDFSFHGFPKDEKLVKVRNVFMFFCRRVERYLGTFSFVLLSLSFLFHCCS